MSRKLTTAAVIIGLLLSAATARAGAVPPVSHADVVSARSIDVYQVRFLAGAPAFLFVAGDGDTDLDLYVYDENGNLIDSDTDESDACLVEFVPRWTGLFTIKIVNWGSVPNQYLLETN